MDFRNRFGPFEQGLYFDGGGGGLDPRAIADVGGSEANLRKSPRASTSTAAMAMFIRAASR